MNVKVNNGVRVLEVTDADGNEYTEYRVPSGCECKRVVSIVHDDFHDVLCEIYNNYKYIRIYNHEAECDGNIEICRKYNNNMGIFLNISPSSIVIHYNKVTKELYIKMKLETEKDEDE